MLKNRANSCKIRSVFFLRKKPRFCCVLCIFSRNAAKSVDFNGSVPRDLGMEFRILTDFSVPVHPPPSAHHCRAARRNAYAANPRKTRKNTILPGFARFSRKRGKIGGFRWERPGRPRCDVPYAGKFRRIRPIYLSTASPPCRSQKRFCHKSGQRRRKNTILPGFAHFFAKTWQNRRIPAGMSRLGSVLYPIF